MHGEFSFVKAQGGGVRNSEEPKGYMTGGKRISRGRERERREKERWRGCEGFAFKGRSLRRNDVKEKRTGCDGRPGCNRINEEQMDGDEG